MRIGVFADTHDHLDNTRRAVRLFNEERCELVLFAGDFVSTFVTPPLRRLKCPLLACFGDNDGNKRGLQNGTTTVGSVGEAPFGLKTPDGTKILVTHMLRSLVGYATNADVVVYAHTHKPRIHHDEQGRLLVNPGETSGWTFRKPSVAIMETDPLEARIVWLPELGPVPVIDEDGQA
ncbi:phosphodiesterase [Planctomycetes bacterium Pan216]|uniref:Phosphoesterase n=1 Tax=Kolteria novifilia TaxID=2527975 RepID=A0A518B0V3_9BACT|nr:phosphodiesterase [Planctomycetes bacterium Pan216]